MIDNRVPVEADPANCVPHAQDRGNTGDEGRTAKVKSETKQQLGSVQVRAVTASNGRRLCPERLRMQHLLVSR